MILFAGAESDDSILTDELCALPWSCIITTRREKNFADKFINNNRKVNEPSSVNDISKVPFDRKKLPIFRLLGIDGISDRTDEEQELVRYGLEENEMENAKAFLKLLPGMLDCLNHMCVVGIDSSESNHEIWKAFGRQLIKLSNQNVTFFGYGDDISIPTNIREMINDRGFATYEQELSEIIKDSDVTFNDDEREYYSDVVAENIFYKNGQSVTIDGDELIQTRNFATLLTNQLIYAYRPYGKRRLKEAFSSFLNDSSSNGPQWYGYLPNSIFYLERPFEAPLVSMVKKALEGNAIDGKYSSQCPIILEGHPGTSKSITLAALAYKIYDKHLNPVIFIKDSNISLNANTREFEELDSLMRKIDEQGKSMRILLIWDCSSHSNVHVVARKLAKNLDDLGRRFVLVCSSYDTETGQNYKSFDWNEQERFVLADNENANKVITVADGCYIVHSTREITDKEKKQLKQKFDEYADISYSSMCWRKLDEEQSDIFMYFYIPINLIRPKLEYGLTREHNVIANFVNEKLDNIRVKYENKRENSSMEEAMKTAGIDLSKWGLSEEDIDNTDTMASEIYDLERFNLCIALFSLFKLNTPVRLALNMLYTNNEYGSNIYRTDSNRWIFEFITNSIPWISYGQDNDGDYIFNFRNVIEAKIYLKEHTTEQMQLDIICSMIDFYINYYERNLYIDASIAKNLQMLLRKVGPNSDSQDLFDNFDYIQKHLNIIIDKLSALRKSNVPDEDAGFATIEITFLREYYVNILNKSQNEDEQTIEWYEKRLEKLREAVRLATEINDKLENKIHYMGNTYNTYGYSKKYLYNQQISLTVELTHCNIEAEKIRKKYIELCKEKKVKPNESYGASSFILPYRESFKRLETALHKDLTNGYTYVAILKLFMEEYQKPMISEETKLQYLSEINMIIDNIDSFDKIYNRGRKNGEDELMSRIAEIMSWSSESNVTIDSIINRNQDINSFLEVYDRMLEADNASAIMFVCRQEQVNAHIISSNMTELQSLTNAQKEVCRKVKEFMEREENIECVKRNAYAVNMLFRVTWMLYEGRPFNVTEECQSTHLDDMQWRDINKICGYYDRSISENSLPAINLIYALSTLQITQNYIQSYEILRKIDQGDFYSQSRMRVPFMYCNQDGSVKKFSGKVRSVSDKVCFADVDGVPQRIGNENGLRFNKWSFGDKTLPDINDRLTELEIGIRYTGFVLYKENGRRRRRGE